MIDGWGISCELAFIWMSLDLTDDKSTMVQVTAWCRQATSHYLSQCWPRSLLPYGVTRPQWVKCHSKCKMLAISFMPLCVKCLIDQRLPYFFTFPPKLRFAALNPIAMIIHVQYNVVYIKITFTELLQLSLPYHHQKWYWLPHTKK